MNKTILSCQKAADGRWHLEIRVDPAAFTAALDRAFAEIRDELDLPPEQKETRAQAEAALGAQYFYPSAASLCCAEATREAGEERGLDLVGYPDVLSCSSGPQGLLFEAACDERPQVRLGPWRNVIPEIERQSVTEDDVDQALRAFCHEARTETPVEGPVKNGDTVRVDFVGFREGKPFPGGAAEDYELVLGSHTFVPGLEEGMVGMTPGETRDIPITFPANYTPELAGKDAVFKVTLRSAAQVSVPQADEAFARKYFEMSLPELRESVRFHMEADREAAYVRRREEEAIRLCCAAMECTLPESMIQEEIDRLTGDLSQQAQRQGISLADWQSQAGLGQEEFAASLREKSEARLRETLLLDAIRAEAGLDRDEASRRRALEVLAARCEAPVEAIEKSLSNPVVAHELLRRQALELILGEKA